MISTEDKGFNNALIASIVLHLFVIGLFLFGVPSFYEKLPDDQQVITFEMLPLSDIVNVKNQTPKQPKVEDVERAKKVLKTKPAEPEKKPELKEEKKEPEKPKEKEKPKDAEPVPTKKEPITPPKKEEKKVTKKEEKKKEKPKVKPKTDDSIDTLLKNLEEASEGDVVNSNKTALKTSTDEGKFAKSDSYTEDLPQSINEQALIRQQISRNWHQQRFMGIPKISEVVVATVIDLDASGRVISVKTDESRSRCPLGMVDICQNVKESVLQAVWNSSPFEKLDPGRYNVWKQLNLDFSPEL